MEEELQDTDAVVHPDLTRGTPVCRRGAGRPQELQQRDIHVRPQVRHMGEGGEHASQEVCMSRGRSVRC